MHDRARIEPVFALLPTVGALLVRRTLRAQFEALVDAIEGRVLASAASTR